MVFQIFTGPLGRLEGNGILEPGDQFFNEELIFWPGNVNMTVALLKI
jgi:hypothetical protein